eukprot:scaffold14379_cov42-Attheya_sp.AAC.1
MTVIGAANHLILSIILITIVFILFISQPSQLTDSMQPETLRWIFSKKSSNMAPSKSMISKCLFNILALVGRQVCNFSDDILCNTDIESSGTFCHGAEARHITPIAHITGKFVGQYLQQKERHGIKKKLTMAEPAALRLHDNQSFRDQLGHAAYHWKSQMKAHIMV